MGTKLIRRLKRSEKWELNVVKDCFVFDGLRIPLKLCVRPTLLIREFVVIVSMSMFMSGRWEKGLKDFF